MHCQKCNVISALYKIMFRVYLISVEVALVYPAGLGKDQITMLAIKGLVRFKCQMSKFCPYYC